MLNLELIRRDAQAVSKALARRGQDLSLDPILSLDARRRQLLQETETLRAQRNQVSKEFSRLPEKPFTRAEEMRQVGTRITSLEEEVKKVERNLEQALLQLPNLPLEDVSSGFGEANNQIVRTVGEPRDLGFPPKPHWELAQALDIIDFQRGVKLSGSRFFILKGLGARLERALITWMLDLHVKEHGYLEIAPPYLVRQEVMLGSGNLPKFGDNLYHDQEDDLWLIPTAEVPLTSLHRDEILEPGTLPLKYVAYSPCFRREKAAAGKDTRGIKRVHQFDKVELYKFVEPHTSNEELEKLVSDAEEVCQRLELSYRVVKLCAGEMGFASAKSYDLEVWAPGCGEWLEVSSCSNCADFQARRANVRYRPDAKARPQFVHTINGSGLALPRIVIAILENYQRPDSSVRIPHILRPYMDIDLLK